VFWAVSRVAATMPLRQASKQRALGFEHDTDPTKATASVAAGLPVRRMYLPNRPERPSWSSVVVLASAAEPPLSAQRTAGASASPRRVLPSAVSTRSLWIIR
jgi:hypothetical protein